MRIAWLIVLLAECREPEPRPVREPTFQEWLDASDGAQESYEERKAQ
jgi:hypothetical protein